MIPKSIRESFWEQSNTIKEYDNRKLLVRNRNATLWNCVLIAKRDIATVSEVNENEAREYFKIINDIEYALKQAFNYDKINYLTLMMADEHVHTHIIPRYKEDKEFAWLTWTDKGRPWPNTISQDNVSQEILDQIKTEILKFL